MSARAYIFHQEGNEGKILHLREFVRRWRDVAEHIAKVQWRWFFEKGSFNKNAPVASSYDEDVTEKVGGAQKMQAIAWQVVGKLQSWVSNRKDEYRYTVECSSLSGTERHQLHVLNLTENWFNPEPVEMEETGEVIPHDVRKLARIIFKRCMSRCRRPDMSGIHPLLDQRMVSVEDPEGARAFQKWLHISHHEKYKSVDIPLHGNPYFRSQPGEISNSVQLICRDNQPIEFRLFRNPDFSDQRESYEPETDVVGLDFGLTPMLATDDGDLLGRSFMEKLEEFDERITELAKYRQEHGMETRSKRYDWLIESLEGYIKTEVNRVLNRLVETKKPQHLVLERLDFRHQSLSKSLNRLIAHCGRSEIKEKLNKLEEEYGITHEEVPAPYSSKTCSSCKYPDPKNRQHNQFKCRFCGNEIHADVNAARNLASRRSWSGKAAEQSTRRVILGKQLKLFVERQTEFGFDDWTLGSGIKGDPADLLSENRYVSDSVKKEVMSKWNDRFASST